MKKILSLIVVSAMFIALGVAVQAATINGAVNISATVPAPSGGPGLPPPTQSISITQVSAAEQCQTGSISWQVVLLPAGSPVLSAGYVEYWPTANPGNKTHLDVTSNITQSVSLSGLSQLTNYSYSIHAVASSYTADSAGTFYTSCGLSNVALTATAKNKGTELHLAYPNYNDIAGLIIYNGQTSCPAAASAEFYKSAMSKAANSSETIAGHSNTVLNQAYGYTACIYNSQGGYSSGAYATAARTVSEAASPGAAPGNGQITLSWSNPANGSAHDFVFSKARLIRVAGACSASTGISDGTPLSEGTGHSYTDSGLTNGQTYNYKVFIKNNYDEYSAGVCLSSVPALVPATAARCPAGVSDQLIENTAQFSWINPQNETGVFTLEKIDWRRSDTACAQSITDGASIFSGTGQSFSDSGLVAGQNYYYTVFVTYSGNQTANCGCTTVAVPKLPEEELCPGCQLIEGSPGFSYFFNAGALEVAPDSQNKLTSLPAQNLNIRALAGSLAKPAKQLAVRLNGQKYFMTLDGTGFYYQASLDLPAKVGRYDLELITVYTDQTYAKRQIVLEIVPFGKVVSTLGRGLPSVDVSLYLYKDNVLYAGYGVKNPIKSGANGVYGFMVPNGRYTLAAVKNDYKETRTEVNVSNNTINRDLALAPIKAESILGDIINNPTVQKANRDVVLPTALAVAVANLITATPLWSFIYYLQLLFTEPWWFLIGRKRKGWGVVYNSITKTPVDLAVVRLYDANTKKLLQSRVTDRGGRYMFLVGEGQYYLEAVNPKFEYPSKIMANAPEDSKYTDIYHGETITIKEGGRGIIVANVPLDQKGLQASNDQIMRDVSRQKLKRGIALIGPVLAIISFIILPGWLTGALVAVHMGMYFMFRRLALKRHAKNWGVIYAAPGKKPLDKAIARIYAPEYGRMLDYYVTDNYGRYGFLAGHNTYYLTAEKPGFAPHKTNNIDLKGKEGDKVVGLDINLNPAGEGSINQPPQSSQIDQAPPTSGNITGQQ